MIECLFASSAEPSGGSQPLAGRLRGLVSRLAMGEKEKKILPCRGQRDYWLLESKARSRCSCCAKRKETSLLNKSKIRPTGLGCAQ